MFRTSPTIRAIVCGPLFLAATLMGAAQREACRAATSSPCCVIGCTCDPAAHPQCEAAFPVGDFHDGCQAPCCEGERHSDQSALLTPDSNEIGKASAHAWFATTTPPPAIVARSLAAFPRTALPAVDLVIWHHVLLI